ncbi:MAG: dTDP-4-dehydrorhamnose reductase [Bacteroidales bacterium]
MKRILVTGADGQLGCELKELSKRGYENLSFIFTDKQQLDITDLEKIESIIESEKIQYVINCAAYTAVDAAEDNHEAALLINATAVDNLAIACRRFDAKLIQISTDYVFDGKSYRPYVESDLVSPTSVYGTTKLLGEQAALSDDTQAIVIRTSWLYSKYGANFVKTMLKLAGQRDKLNVVYDQIGTPTYAADLADAIIRIVEGEFHKGIYHYSNEGVCSWYDFTKAIHRLAGIETCNLYPIESKEYPTRAERPHYSVLNKRKIKERFNISIPYWEDSLRCCIEKLK